MTGFPGSPRLVKAGLVLIDPASGSIVRVIALQINPDTLTRKLDLRAVGEDGNRSQALRLKGPAVETFTLEAQLDATDQLEFPANNAAAVEAGLLPQIATLEALVNPSSGQLRSQEQLAASGTLEIAPMESPLVLFNWGPNRTVPVRVTDLSVAEEAFDTRLNPIRAKVSIGLRTLSRDDLPSSHRGSGLFMAYLAAKEQLARRAAGSTLADIGLKSLP
jgi:hypothetical protein